MMRQPEYDPIQGDTAALFPPSRQGILPPATPGGITTPGMPGPQMPMPGPGMMQPQPMPPEANGDLQHTALLQALAAKMRGTAGPAGV